MAHIPILWQYVAGEVLDSCSVSKGEMSLLVGHLSAILRNEKTIDFKARGYTDEQLKALNKNVKFNPVTVTGLKFTQPLTNFKHPDMGYYLCILENYERGVLPYSGALTDQPAKIMDILVILQSVKSEFNLQRQERELKEWQRKTSSSR